MNGIFLSHQWTEFWRSKGKSGSIATKVVLGFFMLYFLAIAVILGLAMDELIHKAFPDAQVITVFNGFIFYYFLLEIASRIQLQELPTLSIVPYLHLKISKSKIVNFLNIRAFINLFNLIPILLVLPFITKKIIPEYGALSGIALIVSIFSLTVFNNYLVLYIKRKSINNTLYFFSLAGVIGVAIALDYFNILSLRSAGIIFNYMLTAPFIALIFVALAVVIYSINSRFLINNLYMETLSSSKEIKSSTNYSFLDRFGQVGYLAALELKLILRHKRSRSALTMSGLFLLYGLLFYKEKYLLNNEFGYMLFAAIFMTGITILMYGQFMFAWQSAHFDGLLSLKIDFKDFIKAKFLLFTLSSTIVFAFSSFYAFISWKLVLLHLVTYLFNIGVSSSVVLFFALYNKKKLELSKGGSFNYQGVGATQYILSIPIILLPFLIYWPFSYFGMPYVGLMSIGIVGLIMLLLQPMVINYIANKLEEKKYSIAQGFRE